MKKTFQKTLLAAVAGVALMGTASANSLLFPYFNTANGAQSVLSLSNTGTVSATQTVHYVYNYGDKCTHYDANGSLTANDILTHNIATAAAGGAFTTVIADKSTPVYFPLSDYGFLIVSSKTTAAADALRGSMAVIDPSQNLAISYPGIDNGLDTTGAGEGDFSAITDVNFPLSWLPESTIATKWYGVVVGNMNPMIVAGSNWTGAASFTNNGFVYNNDEAPYSGTVTKSITCSGNILPTDLMTAAQAAQIKPTGGLVKATATMSATGTGVVMTKFQTIAAAAGGSFAGKTLLHREQAGK